MFAEIINGFLFWKTDHISVLPRSGKSFFFETGVQYGGNRLRKNICVFMKEPITNAVRSGCLAGIQFS